MKIIIEKEFSVNRCVGGYHVYKNQCEVTVGNIRCVAHETNPDSFIEYNYAIIALFWRQKRKVGRDLQHMSNESCVLYYLKHGGRKTATIKEV